MKINTEKFIENLHKEINRRNVRKNRILNTIYLMGVYVFDFIYIDGYAHTGQDNGTILKDWWPKLKSGGMFAGHDYCKQFPKTIEEVNKFATRHQLKLNFTKEEKYTSWYCIKNKK